MGEQCVPGQTPLKLNFASSIRRALATGIADITLRYNPGSKRKYATSSRIIRVFCLRCPAVNKRSNARNYSSWSQILLGGLYRSWVALGISDRLGGIGSRSSLAAMALARGRGPRGLRSRPRLGSSGTARRLAARIRTAASTAGANNGSLSARRRTVPVSYTHLTLPTNREV